MRLGLLLLIIFNGSVQAFADPREVSISCKNDSGSFQFHCSTLAHDVSFSFGKTNAVYDSTKIQSLTQSACQFDFEKPFLVLGLVRSESYLMTVKTSEILGTEHGIQVDAMMSALDGTAPFDMNFSFDLAADCSIASH